MFPQINFTDFDINILDSRNNSFLPRLSLGNCTKPSDQWVSFTFFEKYFEQNYISDSNFQFACCTHASFIIVFEVTI